MLPSSRGPTKPAAPEMDGGFWLFGLLPVPSTFLTL
jgi:hypothetical protein